MRLLYLGNSSDLRGEVAAADRRAALGGSRLEEATGEPVEVLIKFIWPSERLAGVVESWVRELEADLVLLNVSSWWCESLVVRRKLAPKAGPLAPLVSKTIRAAASRPWIADSRPYRIANRFALKTAGGAPPFRPAEAADIVMDIIRTLLRREDLALCVTGNTQGAQLTGGPAYRAWAAARRVELVNLLVPQLTRLHVVHDLRLHDASTFDPSLRGPDGLHANALGHRRSSDSEFPSLLKAWRQRTAPD